MRRRKRARNTKPKGGATTTYNSAKDAMATLTRGGGSVLTKRIVEKRLRGNLFPFTAEAGRRVKKAKSGPQVLGRRTKKAAGRK